MIFIGLEIPPKDVNMTKSKVAILWGCEDLLGSAVEQLLTTAKDWKIIRIYDESDANLLVREVERVNPDVVILHRSDYASSLLEPLKKLMVDHREMRLIAISLENNLVEVYDKQTVSIKEASDLLSVMEEHPSLYKNEQGGEI